MWHFTRVTVLNVLYFTGYSGNKRWSSNWRRRWRRQFLRNRQVCFTSDNSSLLLAISCVVHISLSLMSSSNNLGTKAEESVPSFWTIKTQKLYDLSLWRVVSSVTERANMQATLQLMLQLVVTFKEQLWVNTVWTGLYGLFLVADKSHSDWFRSVVRPRSSIEIVKTGD